MLKKIFKFYHEPESIEQIQDEQVVKKTYTHFRWRMFYSCFIAYVVFHMIRKNLVVALPDIAQEFNFTNTELGLLGASLYVTYGIGKFINGMLADKSDVRKFIPTALFCSAVANLCFVISTLFITPGEVTFFGLPSATILLWCMAFFWGANGWFQSGGFPPIAKSLSYWYSNSERGTVWSLWSTSHQIGVAAAAFASGYLVEFLGWRAAFYVPAIMCILLSVWLYDRLRDKPQSIGLPDVEVYRGEITKEESTEDIDNRSYIQVLKENILCNKIMWLLAISYVFVYVIRFGTEDWIVKFLTEEKAYSVVEASASLSILAFVGMVGVILSGVISDRIFKGKRAPVNIIYLVAIIFALIGLHYIPAENKLLMNFTVAMTGFCISGPQMLIGGLCAIEASSKKVASAATGFTGVWGYVGAVLSAVGTGFFVDKFQWEGAIIFWIIAALITISIMIVLLFNEYGWLKKTNLKVNK